ncbi:hypothetical protein AMTRI_Chr02g265150 [Amborella trichopoda]
MAPKMASRHALESCTLHLHTWKPFLLDSSEPDPPPLFAQNPSPNPNILLHYPPKKQCLSDRKPNALSTISDSIDLSRLSLFDEEILKGPAKDSTAVIGVDRLARKRRRRGSRSQSGVSSDKGRAPHRCFSDPPLIGTDSSGEFLSHGDGNWGSDFGDNREKEETVLGSFYQGIDVQSVESGYGTEPGYRGDGELGYGDEFDDEEEDTRLLFWGDGHASMVEDMEYTQVPGANAFGEQKLHYRCRRKKHDLRILGSLP